MGARGALSCGHISDTVRGLVILERVKALLSERWSRDFTLLLFSDKLLSLKSSVAIFSIASRLKSPRKLSCRSRLDYESVAIILSISTKPTECARLSLFRDLPGDSDYLLFSRAP